MGVRKSGRLWFAAALAALLCALVAVPAAGHHPIEADENALMDLFSAERESVFRARVAESPALTGIGENMEIVANVPLAPGVVQGGANDDGFTNNAADLELAGDHAFVGSYTQGLVIINIASCQDPSRPDLCKPFVERVFPCSGGQFDIQLSPDAKIAVMAHESASSAKDCHPGEEGAQIFDVSDPTKPIEELAFISNKANPNDSGDTSDMVEEGAHNTTLDWPYLYIDQYAPGYDNGRAEVFDLTNPRSPQRVSEFDVPTQNGETGFHDSIPDHRPDGQHLLYAASIQKSDILDISDPANPQVVQTLLDPEIGISHGAEPNHKRDLLVVTDEYGGGTGVGACGGAQDPDIPDPGPLPNGVGAVHFYNLDDQGLVPGVLPSGNVTPSSKAGQFNIQLQPNEPEQVAAQAGCTSHVFWQAPNQNRMTIAWYGRGTRIVDFEDPSNPQQLGFFVPEGADTWSAKPHCGYIFTGDMVRGVDVLRYTGEGGNAWPTTSGKADPQRVAVQGASAQQTTPCRKASSSGSAGATGTGYSVPSCANSAARRAGRRNVGRIRLGQSRATVRRIMRGSGRYRRFVDRFCLRGGGALRVAYSRRNRVVLILSSSRRTSLARVRRGASARSLRGRVGGLRVVRVGRNVWFTRPRGAATQVFKVQRGRVREVGLANRRLTSTRRKVRRFFRAVR